jgi:hypothetical protein
MVLPPAVVTCTSADLQYTLLITRAAEFKAAVRAKQSGNAFVRLIRWERAKKEAFRRADRHREHARSLSAGPESGGHRAVTLESGGHPSPPDERVDPTVQFSLYEPYMEPLAPAPHNRARCVVSPAWERRYRTAAERMSVLETEQVLF